MYREPFAKDGVLTFSVLNPEGIRSLSLSCLSSGHPRSLSDLAYFQKKQAGFHHQNTLVKNQIRLNLILESRVC